MDGGFVVLEEIDKAAEEGVAVFAPVPVPRDAAKAAAGTQFQPKPGDSPAVAQWRQRMGSEKGKAIYKQRASTVETDFGERSVEP